MMTKNKGVRLGTKASEPSLGDLAVVPEGDEGLLTALFMVHLSPSTSRTSAIVVGAIVTRREDVRSEQTASPDLDLTVAAKDERTCVADLHSRSIPAVQVQEPDPEPTVPVRLKAGVVALEPLEAGIMYVKAWIDSPLESSSVPVTSQVAPLCSSC